MIKSTVDTVFVFRFVRMLTMRWEEMDAYKHGIIDNNGKVLRKASTLTNSDEKNSYTTFVRLVFNIKRLLEKLPFGKTKLGSFVAALWLIKEHAELNNATVETLLEKMNVAFDIQESSQWFMIEDILPKGTYKLQENLISLATGEIVGTVGDKVVVNKEDYIDQIQGINIYEGKVNNQTVFFTQWDIDR